MNKNSMMERDPVKRGQRTRAKEGDTPKKVAKERKGKVVRAIDLKQMNVRIEDELHDALRRDAFEREISISEIVRDIIKKHYSL